MEEFVVAVLISITALGAMLIFFALAAEGSTSNTEGSTSNTLEIPLEKKLKEETTDIVRGEDQTPEKVKQNGILLMVLYGDYPKSEGRKLHVYLDKYGRILLVDETDKLVSQLFRFYTTEIKYDVYRFHGARTTYTGATVGRVHTGGIHTERAHMTAHSCHSGNGPLCCTVAGKEYSIKFIVISDGFFLEQVKSLLKNVGVHSNMMTFENATAEVRKTGQHEMLRKLFGPNKNVISLVNWDGKTGKGHTLLAQLAGSTYEAAEQYSRAKACEFNPLSLNKRIGEVIVQSIARQQKEPWHIKARTS